MNNTSMQQKFLRTTRLILTCLILHFITWYYELPERIWCLITIWFVMLEYKTIGGVYTKSWLRFVGTTASAVFGLIVIYCDANDVIINIIAFICGLFVYNYFYMDSDKSYIAVIGAVTLSIVLLNHNDINAALLRTFNILIGILGCVLMMRFFFPQYARNQLVQLHTQMLTQLSAILSSYVETGKSLADVQLDYLEYEQKTLQNFITLRKLAAEAKIETRKYPTYIKHNNAAITQFRHIFRLVSVFIDYLSTVEIHAHPIIQQKIRELMQYSQACAVYLMHPNTESWPVIEQQDLVSVTTDHHIVTSNELLNKLQHELTTLTEILKIILRIKRKWGK